MKIKVKAATRKREDVIISSDFIRLDSLLKFKGVAFTGGEANQFILDGYAKVNNEICTARGKKIKSGDTVSFLNTDYKIINED